MPAIRLLPPVADAQPVPRLATGFLGLVAAVSTVRSLIHILAPDGGAGSIAGLATDVAGGTNLIGLFAQWGASQLVLALLYWLVILRYRFLVPALLAVVVVEQALRLGAGLLKPLEAATPPPGAIGSWVLLPVALGVLLWTVWPRRSLPLS